MTVAGGQPRPHELLVKKQGLQVGSLKDNQGFSRHKKRKAPQATKPTQDGKRARNPGRVSARVPGRAWYQKMLTRPQLFKGGWANFLAHVCKNPFLFFSVPSEAVSEWKGTAPNASFSHQFLFAGRRPSVAGSSRW